MDLNSRPDSGIKSWKTASNPWVSEEALLTPAFIFEAQSQRTQSILLYMSMT
jgi:hypothetical protein